jgi:hypothetical protein
MKTVKFDEGKKCETSFDFDDDEVIIFGPVENTTYRFIHEGCLKALLTIATMFIILFFWPTKRWVANFILTSKRLVSIPLPPNKKNYPVESFYFTDIVKAYVVEPTDPKRGERSSAQFGLRMKNDAVVAFKGEQQFWVWAKVNAKYFANMAKQLVNQVGTGMLNQLNESADMIQTQHNKDEAEKRGDKSYEVVKTAKYKLEAMGNSDVDHIQIRNFFIDMINECVSIVNK